MTAPRQPWRDTVRVAADLALLGVLVTAAALPVVTAGAAVATGSAALHQFLTHDRWPAAGELWRTFRRGLLPGLGALLCAAGLAALLTVNLLAIDAGVVPGGRPLALLTGAVAAAAAGWAGLVVVRVGARGGLGWRAAARTQASPAGLLAAAGVVALSVFLTVLVHPALTPVLAGFTLFALHAVARSTGMLPHPDGVADGVADGSAAVPARSAGASGGPPGEPAVRRDARGPQDTHRDAGSP